MTQRVLDRRRSVYGHARARMITLLGTAGCRHYHMADRIRHYPGSKRKVGCVSLEKKFQARIEKENTTNQNNAGRRKGR